LKYNAFVLTGGNSYDFKDIFGEKIGENIAGFLFKLLICRFCKKIDPNIGF
jgi:hypothetical protein